MSTFSTENKVTGRASMQQRLDQVKQDNVAKISAWLWVNWQTLPRLLWVNCLMYFGSVCTLMKFYRLVKNFH